MTGCGYLHNAFGPGCPYCAVSQGAGATQALTVEAELIQAGFTKPERADLLASWDKPHEELTPDEIVLLNRHYGYTARDVDGAA